jgi:membrane-bound lytic murein transglycosylase MltF
MQTYSPRDPVREFIAGTLPYADLRLMIETLGPETPWARERNGPWTQEHRLLHSIDTNLRYLRADIRAIVTRQAVEPDLFPTPDLTARQQADLDVQVDEQREVQADLLRVLNDPARQERQESTTEQ